MSEGAGQCRLLAGPAALSAQLLLAALAFASLAYKRHVERPQRPVNIWALDVSKQAISMLAAHVCGMLIAVIAHSSVAAATTSECSWYFVAFTFDTTIGLALTIGLHKAALWGAKKWSDREARKQGELAVALATATSAELASPAGASGPPSPVSAGARWYTVLLECGKYGDPPSYRRWGIQLAEWVVCVVAARALCGTLVVLLGSLLVHVAQGIDNLFEGHPTALLFTVMIACPLCMNICQALVQDMVLKWRSRGGAPAGAAGAAGAAAADAGARPGAFGGSMELSLDPPSMSASRAPSLAPKDGLEGAEEGVAERRVWLLASGAPRSAEV